jgi:hypothetical protein
VGLIVADSLSFGGVEFPESPEVVADQILNSNCLVHSAVTISRDALDEVGRYREEALHAEDHDLWLRLADRRSLANLPDKLVSYRVHGSSNTALRLEAQVTASVAAVAATRVRRSTGADPVRPGEMFDATLVRRLGVDDSALSQRLASAAVVWAGYLSTSSGSEHAAVLLREMLPRLAGSPAARARVLRSLASQEFGQGRVGRGFATLAAAVVTDPRGAAEGIAGRLSRSVS